ncbi:hypothetical protein LSUE1_G010293, partial [Lachnellula suecica]
IALSKTSKRTFRLQKKTALKKAAAASKERTTLVDLPAELLLSILDQLRPSDFFALSRTSKGLRAYILASRSEFGNAAIKRRYAILTQCFPRPVLLANVDSDAHAALQDEERQVKLLHAHKNQNQHVAPPDARLICTCLTCMLAWNNLCLVVDFAHWRLNLEQGLPIQMIKRGRKPQWNKDLVGRNAAVVQKALHDELWYARILEQHLKSTTSAIRRHTNNRSNQKEHFKMDKEDVAREDDNFLEKNGPPTMNFPWHRDNYYMLEAYLPNRGWNEEVGGWRYMPREQHLTDVAFVEKWVRRRNIRGDLHLVLERKLRLMSSLTVRHKFILQTYLDPKQASQPVPKEQVRSLELQRWLRDDSRKGAV